MIVEKTVVLNKIEPAMMNFRAPAGVETKLTVIFLDRFGVVYNRDLAAQLQLTGRSTDRTVNYGMPSIDVVNGKTRAIIPADSLTDPNGYRIRIVGTFDGEPTLLAIGTAQPIASAGVETIVDVIDTVDLAFERNEDANLTVKVWADTGKDEVYDLTSANVSIAANIYSSAGGPIIQPFLVTVLSANEVTLSLTVEEVNALPDQCWWNLQAAAGGGLTTLCYGDVRVTGTVTPPLVETTVNYDYQKPDTGDPAIGQIVHGNFTQNVLKIAKVDADSTDLSATLTLLLPGDQIVISLTTWTVQRVFEAVGWYEIDVLPIQQAAVLGMTPVTFRRP